MDFNPRSREGSGLNPPFSTACPKISIHAPAKGATIKQLIQFCCLKKFQSTLPRRERLLLKITHQHRHRFQSTLPRRERHKKSIKADLRQNFNPRSREGSDTLLSVAVLNADISIHAPAKGATKAVIKTTTAKKFQSTLPRRERLPASIVLGQYAQISIHAPAKGATPKCRNYITVTRNFNPRSREGSDSQVIHPSRIW